MVKFVFPAAIATLALAASSIMVAALPVPTSKWPASTGTIKYDAPKVIKAGEVFDGKMMTYELSNVECQGQAESSKDTMVFIVEAGGTLKNAIIGKNQMEGVHCDKHDCTIENVWWDDVCEDALSIKGGSASSVSKVLGGGARYATDKVVQQNGPGKVTIDGFYAEDFGKLYRSCGTCGDVKRSVEISNVLAVNPTSGIATVNKNYGDEAKFSNIHIQSTKKKVVICGWSQGVAKGEGEPGKLGDGPSPPLCQYSESDIILNGSAGASTGGEAETPAVTAAAPAASADEDDDETDAPVATPAPATADEGTTDEDTADDETKAPAASDDDDGDAETDAPTKAPKTKTPKPSKAPKTPKPSKAPKTPKPSKAAKTPKPTEATEDDDN